MNWLRILVLALALFASQFLVGVIEVLLADPDHSTLWLLAGHIASFAVCTTIFALFAFRTLVKPFTHAWLGLLLQMLVAGILWVVLALWPEGTPWDLVLIEWVVMVAALLAGTSFGIRMRRRTSRGDESPDEP